MIERNFFMNDNKLWGNNWLMNRVFSTDHSVSIDLPGYNKEEISISIDDRIITVSATNDVRGTTTERISIPRVWDMESANASFSNGVLLIEFSLKNTTRKLEIK